MKRILTILLAALPLSPLMAQMNGTAPIPELSPIKTIALDFSKKAQDYFVSHPDEFETKSSLYDILGGGCSYYCCMEIGAQKASSSLHSQGKYNYKPSNAHDLSYATSWVEGVEGDGVGEWIEYSFDSTPATITEVCVVNGLVRTRSVWEANNRVEVLTMLVNGEPYCCLYLKDFYGEQWFDIPDIESSDQPLTIRFRIEAVYSGTKYHDTCISEIYFDGPCH